MAYHGRHVSVATVVPLAFLVVAAFSTWGEWRPTLPACLLPQMTAAHSPDAQSRTAQHQSIRLVSYNICGFGAGFGRVDHEAVTVAFSRVLNDLMRLEPDMVCLEEVRRLSLKDTDGRDRSDSLDALAADLGDLDLHFAHAAPGVETLGNAVLVGDNLRVMDARSCFLDGGSIIRTPAGTEKRDVRGCLAVEVMPLIIDTAGSFSVLSTHLDHISDAERVQQAQSLLRQSALLSKGFPHLLVGDLNAMKATDYSPAQWEALRQRNVDRNWVPPAASGALECLEKAGYMDLLPLGFDTTADEPSACASASPWTLVGPPPTRVDYAYFSPDWKDASCLVSATAWVDHRASGSDHRPLVVDLVLKEMDKDAMVKSVSVRA